MTGRAIVVRGDARALPLPDESVDLIVTSPPYYALRAYTDGGEHYQGQIGSEATPAEYIANLLDCTREWVRVLKPTGSLFVNLGDKYSGVQAQHGGKHFRTDTDAVWQQTDPRRTGIPNKSLMGLPWRYALACIDQLGLILRAEIVWSKPNGLPESATDRVRRSHEQWFHLTRQPRYYSAVDEIREPASDYSRPNGVGRRPRGGQRPRLMLDTCNPLGRLPSSVWEIPSEPLRVPEHLGVDHFAAFPIEWPRRIITGWSPPGICVECGEGRRPVVRESHLTAEGRRLAAKRGPASVAYSAAVQTGAPGASSGQRRALSGTELRKHLVPATITGYACSCPEPTAPTRPALVVDPFGGTGTTALVAATLGRIGITVDRSADYCRLAQWRTTDPGERARAMRVPKPPRKLDGQPPLFGDWAYDRVELGPQPDDADVDGYPLGRAARGGA